MFTWLAQSLASGRSVASRMRRPLRAVAAAGTFVALLSSAAMAQGTAASPELGGEAGLKLPDLSQVTFLGGLSGHSLLLVGIPDLRGS